MPLEDEEPQLPAQLTDLAACPTRVPVLVHELDHPVPQRGITSQLGQMPRHTREQIKRYLCVHDIDDVRGKTGLPQANIDLPGGQGAGKGTDWATRAVNGVQRGVATKAQPWGRGAKG